MSGTLTKRTRDLVVNRTEPLKDIARGAGVSVSWLSLFANGHRASVNADAVQRVYEYLTKSKLEIR